MAAGGKDIREGKGEKNNFAHRSFSPLIFKRTPRLYTYIYTRSMSSSSSTISLRRRRRQSPFAPPRRRRGGNGRYACVCVGGRKKTALTSSPAATPRARARIYQSFGCRARHAAVRLLCAPADAHPLTPIPRPCTLALYTCRNRIFPKHYTVLSPPPVTTTALHIPLLLLLLSLILLLFYVYILIQSHAYCKHIYIRTIIL